MEDSPLLAVPAMQALLRTLQDETHRSLDSKRLRNRHFVVSPAVHSAAQPLHPSYPH